MIKDVSLYVGYIEQRDIQRVEGIVADMLNMYSEPAKIAEKIRDSLYHALSRVYDVNVIKHDRAVTNEDYDYEITINERNHESINFNTYGKFY
ncbi:protein of unknown function [Pseudotevenvirus RB43]|uniref:Uncharacterized protein n=2 Tax=Pseudotevenvirus RB43 TaxID=115991 RepID=Q56BR8_9CAUD|nr:hypothetical protein RB43ORF130c [Escherichia phage RB43]AAX78652.1 hypothetical protein RB43ORF130c [Escherichia phage RB43]CCK73978.1 protein of unknown function [Pseudotevenvirus RB43]CCL97595.1 protein of unknown function [Pseudotevenvirus RB43]